jgi:hypothetical protein
VSESDPALLESIVSEGVLEAEGQEHAEALLGVMQNATQHRQEQDRELLDLLHRGGDAGSA